VKEWEKRKIVHDIFCELVEDCGAWELDDPRYPAYLKRQLQADRWREQHRKVCCQQTKEFEEKELERLRKHPYWESHYKKHGVHYFDADRVREGVNKVLRKALENEQACKTN
jgi:hypothetical protein